MCLCVSGRQKQVLKLNCRFGVAEVYSATFLFVRSFFMQPQDNLFPHPMLIWDIQPKINPCADFPKIPIDWFQTWISFVSRLFSESSFELFFSLCRVARFNWIRIACNQSGNLFKWFPLPLFCMHKTDPWIKLKLFRTEKTEHFAIVCSASTKPMIDNNN